MTQRNIVVEHVQNFGFQPDIIEADHYILGANSPIAWEKLMERGEGWLQYLPDVELQWRGDFDSMNCSNYGTLNCIETLLRRRYPNAAYNFSERFTGVMTGTTPSGNSPHKVIEVIRTISGLIPEDVLPFSEKVQSWADYYSPVPMTQNLLDLGVQFLAQYEVGHDWVFTGGTLAEKQQKLQDALQYSPIGVSVLAWKKRGDMYFKNVGEGDTHWCMLFDYSEGDHWLVFDHYDETIKKLEWDYDFGFAKRYHVKKKDHAQVTAPVKPSLIGKIMQFIKSLFSL